MKFRIFGRGYSIVELMSVVGIAGILTAASGNLMLEGRVAAMRLEMRLLLERRASLVIEHIAQELIHGAWVKEGEGEGKSWLFTRNREDPPVKLHLKNSGLYIEVDGTERLLDRYTKNLALTKSDRSYKVQIQLRRDLLPGRVVQVEKQTVLTL